LSFAGKRLLRLCSTLIGALMFYSVMGLFFHNLSDAQTAVKLNWYFHNIALTMLLGWVYIGSFRVGLLCWKHAFFSLVISNVGLAYQALVRLYF